MQGAEDISDPVPLSGGAFCLLLSGLPSTNYFPSSMYFYSFTLGPQFHAKRDCSVGNWMSTVPVSNLNVSVKCCASIGGRGPLPQRGEERCLRGAADGVITIRTNGRQRGKVREGKERKSAVSSNERDSLHFENC